MAMVPQFIQPSVMDFTFSSNGFLCWILPGNDHCTSLKELLLFFI